MKIHLEFFSILSQWVGASTVRVDLPADGMYAGPLARIDAKYGHLVPSQSWPSRFHFFASQIDLFPNGIHIDTPCAAAPYKEDHFRFMTIMEGE